jgi:hypothetical protein
VQQDYLHDAQPWLPAQMELLADHFTALAHVAPHSMVFLCTAPVTPAALAAARTGGLSDNALLGLLEQARTRHARLGLNAGFHRSIAMVRANPGLREAGVLRRRRADSRKSHPGVG